ncbi:MAG: autotransporter outer membrane beta-barrel domain-containing protein [Methylobacteriaceae bacterium]|jgi:outer membrane autotransporter protein|nr:autotransporter outer membrane beta-barrel domain-containing protein [Methylobacteriaceae bacterium]
MSGASCPGGIFRSAARLALMSSVALGLTVGGAGAQSIYTWTGGGGDSDLFNPANWSGGVSPDNNYTDKFIINSASNISLTGSGAYTVSLHEIGTAPGGVVNVSLTGVSSLYTTYNSLPGEKLVVGSNGGTGVLTVNVSSGDQFRLQSNFMVGIGAGSHGTINFLGSAKGDPSCGYSSSGYSHTVEVGTSVSPSVVDDIVVGGSGGTGAVTFDGISFSTAMTYAPVSLVIGTGAGSNGTANFTNGSKLALPGMYATNYPAAIFHTDGGGNWDPIFPLRVGENGGRGTLTLDRAQATFGNDMLVGVGAGSNGTVNMLNGSKAYSYINIGSYCPPGATCSGGSYFNPSTETAVTDYVQETMSTKIGVNGGTGAVTVMGDNTVWWVGGVTSGYGDNNYTPGRVYVGHSGTGSLTIGDGAEVRLGSGKPTFVYDAVNSQSCVCMTASNFTGDGTLYLATGAGSTGTLSIGSAPGKTPVAPGELYAKRVEIGAGTGAITFNHTAWDYEFDRNLSDGIYGNGTIRAEHGRTILNKNHPGFTGQLVMTGGTLQVNSNFGALPVTVNPNGTLEGTGNVGSINNSGTVSPGQETVAGGGRPDQIGTLTVNGNYTGNNGTVLINTVLGDDFSATDVLAINGNAVGASAVKVINTNGMGDITQFDGIQIIRVGGASTATFTLDGDVTVASGQEAVIGGAYAYTMWHNGKSNPDGAWYLRSEICVDRSCAVDPPTNLPDGMTPGADGTIVLYQPLTPVAELYPRMLASYMDIGTLRQRVGYYESARTSDGEAPASLTWARVVGRYGELPSRRSATSATGDYTLGWVQFGLDGEVMNDGEQSVIAGANVRLGRVSGNVDSFYGDGTIDTTAIGFGTTMTWYGPKGVYLDGVLQLDSFSSDLDSQLLGVLKHGADALGVTLSLEGGKRWDINENWALTPQAQLSYTRLHQTAFLQDRFGAKVSFSNEDALVARLGTTVDYENRWQQAAGEWSALKLWAGVNLYANLLDGPEVEISRTQLPYDMGDLWGGAALGWTYSRTNGKFAFFGEVGAKTGLEEFGKAFSVEGQVGIRFRW